MTSIDLFPTDSWNGPFRMVECHKALSPSKLPGIDWALNPYSGCAHLCAYCFAPELTHSPWEEWGMVRVKRGIASKLERELVGLRGVIGIGTVTDPWQAAESRFRNTQSCLRRLLSRPVGVHCHTKSDLVLRDREILAQLRAEVGVTVTSLDDSHSFSIEPGAPCPERRLTALKELHSTGIECYALVGPVLDVLEGREADLVQAIADSGVHRLMLDALNPRPLLAGRLAELGRRGSPTALQSIRRQAMDVGMEVMDAF